MCILQDKNPLKASHIHRLYDEQHAEFMHPLVASVLFLYTYL